MSRYDDDDTEESTPATKVDDDAIDTAPGEATAAPEREKVSDEVKAQAGRVIKRGWGAAEQTIAAGSPFSQGLKLSEKPILVKFLESEPYASFRQHWLEKEGQKSYTCLADIDPKGCPLCDAGHRPSARFSFNVALIDGEGGEALLRSYDVGPRVIDQLKNIHQDPRMGPLEKHYWAVSRTGKKSTSQTSHNMVRERDLDEEWPGFKAMSEDEIAALKKTAYTQDIVQLSPRKALLTIAAEELGAD
jgi:hypothetical protein